eukprot:765183-Hanusia_phi.AAC.1
MMVTIMIMTMTLKQIERDFQICKTEVERLRRTLSDSNAQKAQEIERIERDHAVLYAKQVYRSETELESAKKRADEAEKRNRTLQVRRFDSRTSSVFSMESSMM